jgi:hypothetical protein
MCIGARAGRVGGVGREAPVDLADITRADGTAGCGASRSRCKRAPVSRSSAAQMHSKE